MSKQKTSVDALQQTLDTSVARFHFRKKDGSVREALGTRCINLIPKGDAPSILHDTSDKAIVYWDLEQEGFRSVSVSSLVWM